MLSDARVEGWSSTDELDTKSFHPFPRLPNELQEMIWERALPGPRVLTVELKTDEMSLSEGDITDVGWIPMSEDAWLRFNKNYHSPNPALLSTCQRSRNVASKTYKLAFGTSNTFVDFEKDIFYFVSCTRFLGRKDWAGRSELQYLQIFGNLFPQDLTANNPLVGDFLEITHLLVTYDTIYFYLYQDDDWLLREHLQDFPGLEELSFMDDCTSLNFKERAQLLFSKNLEGEGEEEHTNYIQLLEERFLECAIPGTLEDGMTKEELSEKTHKCKFQTVTLKKLGNRELLREQEFRTGNGQEGMELYVSYHRSLI